IDSSNPARLLLGLDHLYESTNQADNWTAIASPNTGGFNTTNNIDAVAVAATAPNTIYVSAGSSIFVTTNDGSAWTARNIPGVNSGVRALLVDPNDSSIVYAVRNQFGGGKVYRST